jgi:hypothetical protein
VTTDDQASTRHKQGRIRWARCRAGVGGHRRCLGGAAGYAVASASLRGRTGDDPDGVSGGLSGRGGAGLVCHGEGGGGGRLVYHGEGRGGAEHRSMARAGSCVLRCRPPPVRQHV